MYERALEGARRLRNVPVMFLALTGMAGLHRLHGRNDAAAAAATEGLELYRAGDSRRFRNRVDTQSHLRAAAAVCCSVLAAIAAEGDDPDRAASLLGQAERLRADSGAEVPPFQHDDVAQARETAVAALGSTAFLAALKSGRIGAEVA
jgi:hypothetical protein